MAQEFFEAGVAFTFPDNWTLEREDLSEGWSVTVQSPSTAFFFLCFREDSPDCNDLITQTLNDMTELYPDLEAEPGLSRLAGRSAVGHDIRFFSFDLTNSCWTRCFAATAGTILILWQVNDLEAEEYESALRAIGASLRVGDV